MKMLVCLFEPGLKNTFIRLNPPTPLNRMSWNIQKSIPLAFYLHLVASTLAPSGFATIYILYFDEFYLNFEKSSNILKNPPYIHCQKWYPYFTSSKHLINLYFDDFIGNFLTKNQPLTKTELTKMMTQIGFLIQAG